jgi:hypothetical protein
LVDGGSEEEEEWQGNDDDDEDYDDGDDDDEGDNDSDDQFWGEGGSSVSLAASTVELRQRGSRVRGCWGVHPVSSATSSAASSAGAASLGRAGGHALGPFAHRTVVATAEAARGVEGSLAVARALARAAFPRLDVSTVDGTFPFL